MNTELKDKRLNELARLLSDLFIIDAYYVRNQRADFSLRYRAEPKRSRELIQDRLKLAGYQFEVKQDDNALHLSIGLRRKLVIPRLNIILFVATLLTTYLVPVFYGVLGSGRPDILGSLLEDLAAGKGLEFTAALMGILFVHEMGHFVASRRRGIITSWPYFIPAPNFIGTFGAIIKSKSPFWNRRDLIEVGAAGPIAGWVVAVVCLIYGLSHSSVVPTFGSQAMGLQISLFGESILVHWLVPMILGSAGPHEAYLFSEAAFAGWVGLLVTAINMLPIGQLDGGHVLYGLFGKVQHRLGWLALFGLGWLGFYSSIWWFFAAIGLIMGATHPPTLNDKRPPGRAAVIVGLISLIILILSFTPIPFLV